MMQGRIWLHTNPDGEVVWVQIKQNDSDVEYACTPSLSNDMVFYAFRYCLGRQTYAVNDCVKYLIANWEYLPIATCIFIQNDIRKHFKRIQKPIEDEWQRILSMPLPNKKENV